MTQSGSVDRRRGVGSGGLLAVAVALGLVVAAVAIRAAAGAALRNAGIATGIAVGLGFLFAVTALIIASKYRGHVRMTDVPTSALDRLRQATVAVLFASAVLVPLALMMLRRPDSGQGQNPTQLVPTNILGSTRLVSPPPTRDTHHNGHSFSFDLTAFLWVLLAIIGTALVIVIVLVALRLLRKIPQLGPVGSAPPIVESSAEDEALADALLAGRSALGGDDARAAIIACYAAMERSLAQAGVTRERSDSPSDLLHRATGRDLPGLGTQDAETLTDLFREARFSSHPMTAQHLDAARRALDSVTSALAERLRARSEDAAASAQGAVERVISS
ncbi:DUF4129 domain-containing protein [Actinocrinis sp.]|uniref:DUF4129 domain-containing protein n=1 Tax=Actinocrinis sp. TaxID=1920516 RepID=UPI002C0863A3|nr:DUF4129 domain-containing protein [Actinocrinis sp.]HXR70461.1 DUF4129 domain-containing protein [Actinocrinis sp.]